MNFTMKRSDIRKLKEKEPNALIEFMKTEKHYFKDLQDDLKKIRDPRHQSYITYGIEEIIHPLIMKNVCNLQSMQAMTNQFNDEVIIKNFGIMIGKEEKEELPHYVTINDCLKGLENKELEKIRTKMIRSLIRKRSFEKARFQDKYWLIVVDATQIFSFKERHCKHCLTRTHIDEKTGEATIRYYHNVLEAKIILGDSLVVSIGTEFIENEKENVSKQDCERNAFKRLAKKLKKSFKRLPICIMGDSLYACEPVFKICDEYDWKYLIRFKDGSIRSVAKEFHELKDMEMENQKDEMKWVNGIGYNQRTVNVMEYHFQKKEKNIRFQWITNVKITGKTAKEFAETGRKRWKIENEGFNIQKNHRYNITHANSLDYNAMKNHYLIIQIADILLQLYEQGAAIIRQLKKSIKNISSDLLNSFGRLTLTKEDILQTKKRISINVS